MAAPTEPDGVTVYSVVDSVTQRTWRKISWAAAIECGPAAQTLAGLWRISQKGTFCSQEKIASSSRVPLSTCRKHLKTLTDKGWLENIGKRTRSGRIRRTVEFRLTKKARYEMKEGGYGMLPWWALRKRFNWSDRVVMALWFSRFASLIRVVNDYDEGRVSEDVEDVFINIEELIVGDIGERFTFTLSEVKEKTGLARPSFVRSKKKLKELGLFTIATGPMGRDLLRPNVHFRVVETPSKRNPGMVTINFQQNPKG